MAPGNPLSKKPSIPDLSAEASGVLDELHAEPSDRARAIVACAYIEDILCSMLRARLCAERVTYGGNAKAPVDEVVGRAQFAGSLDLCFCLGMVGPEAYHDLRVIDSIRNRFSHRRRSLAFSDPSVGSQIALLKTPKPIELAFGTKLQGGERFLTAVAMLMNQLMLHGLSQSAIPVGKDFHVVQSIKV